MTASYDVIIAGGGTAGVILANRIRAQFPGAKILIAEKEPALGGRVRSIDSDKALWNYGLNAISKQLHDFLEQTLKSQLVDADIDDFTANSQKRIGVLAGNKLVTLDQTHMFDKKGARLVGGAAAARDWTHFDELMADVQDPEKRKQSVGQLWKGKRKSPSAIVLEHLARAVGIPNIWTATGSALKNRINEVVAEEHYFGKWAELYQTLLNEKQVEEGDAEPAQPLTDIRVNCAVVDAIYHNLQAQWEVITSQGPVHGKILVVAQSPWDAIRWLPKKEWPIDLLNIVNKAKPASVLTLTENLYVPTPELKAEISELIIVPAEECQVVVSNDHTEIIFQATLDYEMSVQAPDVVKAVKRLKRARRKFVKAFPDCKLSGDHLALQPVGWAQPVSPSDRRLVRKLAKSQYNSDKLVFCGDAYGLDFAGDVNIIQSVLGACESIASGLAGKETECQPTS